MAKKIINQYHFVFFKKLTKTSSIEDKIYSTGKTYQANTFVEAVELFERENKKVTLIGCYNLDAMSRIKSLN